MKFMLDTNTCIYLIKKKPAEVIGHFKRHKVGDVGISSIVLAELQYGVEKSQHVHSNRVALEEFIAPLEIATFDEAANRTYGKIRSHLEKTGTPIGSMDTLIGAHALSLAVTLVTNNVREFNRINNLKIIDWTV